MRVLVIGPWPDDSIEKALRRAHILADRVESPEPATGAPSEDVYDVVLHLASPTHSIEFMRQARADGIQTPVLIVSAHASGRERAAALDAGADDYLTQPFLMAELVARVRALGRRRAQLQSSHIQAGDLEYDCGLHILRCGEQEVRLSAREGELIELLVSNPSRVLPRAFLQQKLWGCDAEPEYNGLEVYLSLVRRKLRALGSGAQVRAMRGVGYYLEFA